MLKRKIYKERVRDIFGNRIKDAKMLRAEIDVREIFL